MDATVVVFTFDTTHHALWAEDVAREHDVPVETGPPPPESDAKCGIALRTPGGRAEELTRLYRDEGIEFGRTEG